MYCCLIVLLPFVIPNYKAARVFFGGGRHFFKTVPKRIIFFFYNGLDLLMPGGNIQVVTD